MDPAFISDAVAVMGPTLTALVTTQTSTWVQTKIEASKRIKDADALRSTYDEIINKLLEERSDAIRIAQVYQSELERIQISDSDIEQLHSTIERLVDIIDSFSGSNAGDNPSVAAIKELVNADTLRTLQLLGFNFKAAIGEPLTKLCANAIMSMGNTTKTNRNTPNSKRR